MAGFFIYSIRMVGEETKLTTVKVVDLEVKKFQEHRENLNTLSNRNCCHNFKEKKNPNGLEIAVHPSPKALFCHNTHTFLPVGR